MVSIPKPEIPGHNKRQKTVYIIVFALLLSTALFMIIALTTPLWAQGTVQDNFEVQNGKWVKVGSNRVTVGLWQNCNCSVYNLDQFPVWVRVVQALIIMATVTALIAICAFVVRIFVTDTKLFITTVLTGTACLVTAFFLLLAVAVYAGRYRIEMRDDFARKATDLGAGFGLTCTSLFFSLIAGVLALITIRWEM